jgi:hypothetical protein
MRQRLTKEEEDFKSAHVYNIKRNCCSLDQPFRSGRLYTKYRLLEEEDNWDNKVKAFEHPLWSYRKYLTSLYSGFTKVR